MCFLYFGVSIYYVVPIVRVYSRRNGSGGRGAEGDDQTHMAITGQKDFGLAHSEK